MSDVRFERLFDAVDHYARVTPDNVAMWFGGVDTTYREFAVRVDLMARALVGWGLAPGERVCVLTTPRPEFWVALHAIHKAGGIYVGINPSYSGREQMHVVSDSQPVLILSLDSFAGRSYSADIAELMNQVPSVRAAYRLTEGPGGGVLRSFDDLVACASGVSVGDMPQPLPMDPSTIVYTSGSSGAPKGAVLPHVGIAYGAHCDADQMAVETPRVACNLPANHLGCIVDVCGSTLVEGGMIAWTERFDPAETLRLVEELRLTNLQHVPTVLQLVALHPDFTTRDLSSLKLVAWGGAALPIEFVRVYRELGVRLFTIYGMTETCGNATFSQLDDDDETLATTVGLPNPDAEVRIVDDEGHDVADGEEGEVLYKHHARMLYYLNNPEATAKTLDTNGYLHTGDIAVRLPNGYLRLVGRKSEMFKSGGLNVYPREIELQIEAHPAVAIAAVVGVPDATYSEVGVAFVVPEDGATVTEDEIRLWCKESLAGYKVPKKFLFQSELPLLPIGKVDKQALKKLAAS